MSNNSNCPSVNRILKQYNIRGSNREAKNYVQEKRARVREGGHYVRNYEVCLIFRYPKIPCHGDQTATRTQLVPKSKHILIHQNITNKTHRRGLCDLCGLLSGVRAIETTRHLALECPYTTLTLEAVLRAVLESTTLDEAVLEEVRGMGSVGPAVNRERGAHRRQGGMGLSASRQRTYVRVVQRSSQR